MTPEPGGRRIVLVAVDISPEWQGVVTRGVAEATALDADIHLIYSLALPAVVAEADVPTGEAAQAAMLEERAAEGRAHIAAVEAHVGSFGMVAATHLAVGEPWREIVQLAGELGADLVVVGTHDVRGVARLLLGSVAAEVVRNAPCEVLVVREKRGPGAGEPHILPPCGACVAIQGASGGRERWCERHRIRHARAHTYLELPEAFGVGSLTTRDR